MARQMAQNHMATLSAAGQSRQPLVRRNAVAKVEAYQKQGRDKPGMTRVKIQIVTLRAHILLAGATIFSGKLCRESTAKPR